MINVSETTRQVDLLMQTLYRHCKGQFIQTILASYDIADQWRNYLQPEYPVSRRPIMRLASMTWLVLKHFGFATGIRLSFFVWFCLGLPLLIRKTSQLHQNTFTEDGKDNAEILLLRTGVANESNIAAWIGRRHGGKQVNMLAFNDVAGTWLSSIKYLPMMFRAYSQLMGALLHPLLELHEQGKLNTAHKKVLPPVWLVLLARRAPLMCQYRCWAELFLSRRNLTHLYFTMNSTQENAFMAALPNIDHAYVEHGFPRRDIPPLNCRQYVYGEKYAQYLRSFDPDLQIEEIGTDYFPSEDIGSKERSIVVASLQDWPQWGINRVADCFNQALALAKAHGWHIVFRGRNFDEDAFARGLQYEWDEISTPQQESFAECLRRVKPSMVWTTWSTAVLDAKAMGIQSICFVDDQLSDYFLVDLEFDAGHIHMVANVAAQRLIGNMIEG